MENEYTEKFSKELLPCKICGRAPKIDFDGGDWGYKQGSITALCNHSDKTFSKNTISSVSVILDGILEDGEIFTYYSAVVKDWNILNRSTK